MSDASQVRINELARELEVKAKAIIDLFPGFGVTEKKTHSSSIPVEVAEKVRHQLKGVADAEAAAEVAAKEAVKPAAKPAPAPVAAAPAPVAAKPAAPHAPAVAHAPAGGTCPRQVLRLWQRNQRCPARLRPRLHQLQNRAVPAPHAPAAAKPAAPSAPAPSRLQLRQNQFLLRLRARLPTPGQPIAARPPQGAPPQGRPAQPGTQPAAARPAAGASTPSPRPARS